MPSAVQKLKGTIVFQSTAYIVCKCLYLKLHVRNVKRVDTYNDVKLLISI